VTLRELNLPIHLATGLLMNPRMLYSESIVLAIAASVVPSFPSASSRPSLLLSGQHFPSVFVLVRLLLRGTECES